MRGDRSSGPPAPDGDAAEAGGEEQKAAAGAPRKRPTSAPSGSRSTRQAQAGGPADVHFPIVAVGASAGGLEAFSQLLEHLPPDTGLGFVLIQHLAPTHKTILPEILSRRTTMPVVLAADEMELRPDHVYVSPPGKDLTVFHGRLGLMERQIVGGAHLPVDYFMRSLALDQRSHAIGVVLSGSASDGTLGLTAIKAEGGITFAQDPESAAYDGMPTAAIRANVVDMMLEPREIALELARLGKHPYLVGDTDGATVTKESVETEADWLNKIFVLLRSVYGVDFSAYRSSTIRRRVDRRMALYRLESVKEYLAYLRERPSEVDDLYHDILIMVTEFFREPEAFAALAASVLPAVIAAKQEGEQVRVWVPGCSTGEEPYSLALVLTRALQQSGRNLGVKIFATDINERDIDQARHGIFSESKFAAVPEDYRHHFSPADGGYQISKSIRDMIIFARHDVTSDPPFSQIDLVSCRNLLIYLGAAAQEAVMPVFHYALRPQGHLLLGASESIGSATDLFAAVDTKSKLFVKKAGARRAPAFGPSTAFGRERTGLGTDTPPPGIERRFDPQRAAEEILLTEFAPPSVVVDDDFEIIQFRGATDEFLQHVSGRATLNVLEMAREGLAAEIRAAVDGARDAGAAVVRNAVRYRDEGDLLEVGIQAVPLKAPAGEKYFLVLFGAPAGPAGAEQTDVQARASGDDQTASERSQIEDLQRELSSMREYVQALVLDKEAAFEELRAASEEVQSSNEELQSMNEELETAKEELQSANEELRTVNEELETRNAELSDANGDLRNLLRAVNIPTIIVGRDLRIRRFTPGAERVMNIIATDVGRPITDIALRVDVTDLEELLQQAIENIAVAEREVRDEDGRWYAMQARPYQTETNRIEGAVLTLRDVDEQRRALARSRQAADLSAGMNEVLTALLAGHPLERVMRVVLFEAIATVGASVGVVLMRAGDAWEVRYAQGGSEGIVGRTLADDEVPQATMAETTRAPIAVQSGEGSSQLLPPGYGDSAVVAAPLLADGQVRGVLLFSWQQPEQAPDEAQVDFVNKVGGLVSLALAGE